MNNVLAINVHGAQIFQEPKQFPKAMRKDSMVLRQLVECAEKHMHPLARLLLPPSDSDWQHLSEWRATADYAATTLSMVAGIVDLETGFKSPLLGEPKNSQYLQCQS
jgi:hypothetical protein